MTETEQSIYLKRFEEREHPEDRLSLNEKCQRLRRGCGNGLITFQDLRRACRFLSTLIRSVDRDAGDLCLLASHAENLEQFVPICEMSRQRRATRKDAEGRMEEDLTL